jgi:hypothetical protein
MVGSVGLTLVRYTADELLLEEGAYDYATSAFEVFPARKHERQ